MITAHCQRWSERRAIKVGSGTTINPAAFAVDVIAETRAKAFVVEHHYSGTFPAARLSVGLFRGRELVGAAVFSEGIQRAALPKWAGVSAGAGCELGRLVLLDSVAGDGETWFLSRAFNLLLEAKREIHAVLSYADPIERRDANGRIVKPGHVGTIYQALSARYRGRTGKRTAYVTPAGEIVSGRALSKIRLEERGIDYAAEQLHRMGAPRRERFETGPEWIQRLVDERFLRTTRHPGNHAYVFPLTRKAKAATRPLPVEPYPKVAA